MITTILPAKMNLEATSKDNSTVFTRAASFVSRLVLSSSTLNCPTIANNTLAYETRTGRETHLVPSFLFYFWFYTHTHFMYQPVGQLSIGVMEVLVHYVGFRLCFPRMSLSFRSLQWVHLDRNRKLWPTTPSTKDMKLELFECNTHNDLIPCYFQYFSPDTTIIPSQP